VETLPFTSLVFVAGLSGAGKSTAVDILSDQGFYAIENLPIPLVRSFFALARKNPQKFRRSIFLLDIDSAQKCAEFLALLEALVPEGKRGPQIRLLFFDSRNQPIVKRYSESRRPHPFFDPKKDRSLLDTIQRERSLLMPIKERAHLRIDTSEMTIHELKRVLGEFNECLNTPLQPRMRVNFLSFGFKYGVPIDCDVLFDVRFLPNPHFVPKMREHTGLQRGVKAFVLKNSDSKLFLKKTADLLNFLLPRYLYEGKSYLNIGIGCTGGRHRSVVLAESLKPLIKPGKYLVSVTHRDIHK
jgi:RNase adapter protein RapZ